MDLLDKLVRTGSTYLTMKRRTALVKRYNVWRHGDLIEQRQRVLREWRGPSVAAISDGYLVDRSGSLAHLQQMLNDADTIIAEGRTPKPRAKDYLINHLTTGDLGKFPSFLDFACSDQMVAIAGNYLGMLPVLSTVELWRSGIHAGGEDVGSQMLHLDNADDKQVKVFVNLHDIDVECGPFAFFPRGVSQRICDSVNYGKVKGVERVTDEQAFAVAKLEDLQVCTGGRGDVFMVDTISCLHYGSRGNSRPRYVLMCQYLSPCRADFRPQAMTELLRPDDATVRKFLLDPDHARI